MPINKELRDKYPDDWQEIRERILEREGRCCKFCGLIDGDFGYRDADGTFHSSPDDPDQMEAWEMRVPWDATCFRIHLTIAHLDHDVEHNDDSNLAALCCQCHNRHDGHHRARNRSKTRDRRRGQDRFWDNP